MGQARDPAALKQYYQTCGVKKGEPADLGRRRRRRKIATDGTKVTKRIKKRQGGVCIAYGISPVCTRDIDDPHEIVPRGTGGKKSDENSVGICRACHNAAQGTVGGVKLVFYWKGKEDGLPPRADIQGHVWCRWVGKRGANDGRNGGAAGQRSGLRVRDDTAGAGILLPSVSLPARHELRPADGRGSGDLRRRGQPEGAAGDVAAPGGQGLMVVRRGSALRRYQARLDFLKANPWALTGVPGINDDVTPDGKLALDALHALMTQQRLFGAATTQNERDAIRRLASELRGEHVAGGSW